MLRPSPLLRDANAPLDMLAAARHFHCPHCDLMARRTGAVRPVQVSRSKELGHTISIYACHWKRNRDGREAIIVNIIDEASRCHVALVLKEGEPSELGLLTAMDYIEAVRMNGFRLQGHQLSFAWSRKVRSNLTSFEIGVQLEALNFKWRQVRAHWQIGVVEIHIWLLKNQVSLMEDEFPEASIEDLFENCVAAKVGRQTFDRYSPLHLWFGTQCAQTAFVRADARKTLRMAQYARSRVLRNPTVGQLVRYF